MDKPAHVRVTNQHGNRNSNWDTSLKRRLGQAARWLKYRVASRAVILMYHRVTDLPNDPFLLSIKPKHFAEQMEVIRRRRCIPMRLQELVGALHLGKVPDRAVVVTFDDGYADNLHHARPILEHYEIPTTVFVTAGHVSNQREFWWDEMDRILLQPGVLPRKLRLNINGNASEWDLGDAASYTEDEHWRDRDWHIEREHAPTSRHRLFRMLYSAIAALTSVKRQKVMDDLLSWSGATSTGRPTHRTLTTDELVLLQEDALIDIGAHTVTHPSLAALSPEEQQTEIQESKRFLEQVSQRPVTSFAFPHGSTTPETIKILQQGSFVSACCSHADAVWRGTDCYQLPRLGVRDWDKDIFGRWLRWWMDG